MSIRGRNASGLLNQSITLEMPLDGTTDAALYACLRSHVFIKEAGCTITNGSVGDNVSTDGNTKRVILKKQSPGDSAAVTLCTFSFAANALVGTELTTRDGSETWQAAYKNAADRVFPKGTKFFCAPAGDGGSANDKAICYIQIEEAGAAPA